MELNQREPLLRKISEASTFVPQIGELGDSPPIKSVGDFWEQFKVESKKLWYLAAPAICTFTCEYSLNAITLVFAGQVGTLELAAIAIANSVIYGFSMGLMLGMGSAVETLYGQAWGAGHYNLLGVYLQHSWIILIATAILLTPVYIFVGSLLRLIGQQDNIAAVAGRFTIWTIPQLYAFAVSFPIITFLQAQSKMMVLTWIAAVALVFHMFFSWLLMLRLGWGLFGAAVVLNLSIAFMAGAQFVYVVGGGCREAWNGFSWKAFHSIWGFFRLSLASAVMLCMEEWYFMVLILFAGYLKNAEISVDAYSICMNILDWTIAVAFGWNMAASVRISNELGAGHPRTAKFSVVVVVITSSLVAVILSLILIITRKQYPSLFTISNEVQEVVIALTPILVISIIVSNVQSVLSGVAISAGWQTLVAYVNIGSYYVFGVPLGLILGYKLDFGVEGIWWGMLLGTVVQTLILFSLIYRTDWDKEASIAEERIRKWGGEPEERNNGIA